MRWDFISIYDSSKYSDVINYFEDDNFNIESVESGIKAPNIHEVLDIEIDFSNENTMVIRYDKKDSLLAFCILCIRILDDSLDIEEIEICGFKKKNVSNTTDVKDLFLEFFDDIYRCNEIKVVMDDANFRYSKELIVFVISSKHSSYYYLKKELDRWQGLNR